MPKIHSDGAQPFNTSEKILAFCLNMAGCQFLNNQRPCVNVFDKDILFRIGGGQRDPKTKEVVKPSRFAGMSDWDAAQAAWKEQAEGHVEFEFLLTQECHDLIRAYRDQRAKMDASDGSAQEMAAGIMSLVKAEGMSEAEGILRLVCLAVKIRPEFLALWKTVVPDLHRDNKGKPQTTEGTATNGRGQSVPSTRVKSPGYKRISLNASENLRKQMEI